MFSALMFNEFGTWKFEIPKIEFRLLFLLLGGYVLS